MDPYIGCVIIFGGNFAMRGFATCSGQLLPISQNTALFSLLGTYYGGNGTSNFACGAVLSFSRGKARG
jgi:microcystin-dependent protein